MNPLLFALISYLGWGTSDIFGTIASRKVGIYTTAFYAYFIGFLISLLFIPFILGGLRGLTFGIFVFSLFLGSIFLVATVTFFEALRIGKASIVGTIAASFTALVVVFSIVFLKEKVTLIQVAAITIIFIGAILTTLDFSEIKKKSLKLDRSIILALLTMLIWGVYFTFIKIPVRHIGWFWADFISTIPFPLLLIYAKNKGGIKIPKGRDGLPVLASAVLGIAANYSYNFAIGNGLTTIVAPVAGSYPTLFVILAFLIFKEPIKKHQLVGIVVALAGIIFLGIVSR